MIAKVNPADYDLVVNQVSKLEEAWKTGDDFEMVRILKQIVPDFRSNNSKYESLDKPLPE